MARVHGKDLTSVNVDDSSGAVTDLKADTVSVSFSVGVDSHDTTTIGDSWHEWTAGLKGGDEFTHEMFYNNTASTGTWALYTGRLGVTHTFSFTDGTRTVSMETLVTKLSLPVQVADMIKFTATHKINGAVTFS